MPGVVPGLDIDAQLKTSAVPHPERNLCSLLKLHPACEKTGRNLITDMRLLQARELDFLEAIEVRI